MMRDDGDDDDDDDDDTTSETSEIVESINNYLKTLQLYTFLHLCRVAVGVAF